MLTACFVVLCWILYFVLSGFWFYSVFYRGVCACCSFVRFLSLGVYCCLLVLGLCLSCSLFG